MQQQKSKVSIATWPRMLGLKKSAMVAVASLALLGGCTEPVVQPEQHIGLLPAGSFRRGWFIPMDLKTARVVSLDVRDKTIYVYTSDKKVTAFDRKAGTFKFAMEVPTPEKRVRPLVELKDMLVFPNFSTLEVFTDRGEYLRSIPLEGVTLRSNAVGDGSIVYFGAVGLRGGLVEAYDMNHPLAPKKWDFLTRDGGDVTAAPSVYGGFIYAGSESPTGEVDAVNGGRTPVWDTDFNRFYASGPIVADLQTDEAGLYVSSKDSKMYCINRISGKLKWQYFAGAALTEPVSTASDTIYQYVNGKGLVAIDKMTGEYNRKPRWVYPGNVKFLSQDDRNTYIVEERPNAAGLAATQILVALNKTTGMFVFEAKRTDFSVFGVNHKDGTIYAATPDGKIVQVLPNLKAGEIGEMVAVPSDQSKFE